MAAVQVTADIQAGSRSDIKFGKVFGGTDDTANANGLRKFVGFLKAGKAFDRLFGCVLAGWICEQVYLALPGMFTGQLHPSP